MGRAVAARGRGTPRGRRTQRRGAGHRGEPLPVRTGARRADARGNARLGSRQEGPGAGEDDRRRVRGSPGRAGPGGQGSRERLHGCRPRRLRPRAASHRQSASGKTVSVVGSTDQPHTWTDVRDMGRALATVATEESSWGRVWHAPSNAPRTQAEAVNDVLASVGAKPVTVKAVPNALLALASPFVPILRELRETLYQFTSPYVMDSSAITEAFGLEPTPWDEVCRRTATSPRRSFAVQSTVPKARAGIAACVAPARGRRTGCRDTGRTCRRVSGRANRCRVPRRSDRGSSGSGHAGVSCHRRCDRSFSCSPRSARASGRGGSAGVSSRGRRSRLRVRGSEPPTRARASTGRCALVPPRHTTGQHQPHRSVRGPRVGSSVGSRVARRDQALPGRRGRRGRPPARSPGPSRADGGERRTAVPGRCRRRRAVAWVAPAPPPWCVSSAPAGPAGRTPRDPGQMPQEPGHPPHNLCPRGDLNPHARNRALAPQASASANSATRTSAPGTVATRDPQPASRTARRASVSGWRHGDAEPRTDERTTPQARSWRSAAT